MGLGLGLENKERSKEDQKKIKRRSKSTTKPLLANLDITLSRSADRRSDSKLQVGRRRRD